MTLLHPHPGQPLQLRLARDLTRAIKRGHPWVYAEALRQLPPASPGAPAVLLDNKKGREIGRGFYDPHSPLALRICTTEPDEKLNERWAQKRLERALALRRTLFDERTTGFRLFNGEGDGLPGLIADVYGDIAVLQLDGAGPAGFGTPPELRPGWLRLCRCAAFTSVANEAALKAKVWWGKLPLRRSFFWKTACVLPWM
ncbi:MAG: hypothetical protein HC875_07515 [Anaerolineales bacterium]|nr:hypothetical protein [Anaerolineales bacterium]